MSERTDGAPPEAAPTVDIRFGRADAAAIVYLTGELDLAADDEMTTAIDELLTDSSLREVTFDLAGVSFCDSSGIAILIRAWQIGQSNGTAVHITAAQPRVAAVLRLTGVWSLLGKEPPPDGGRPDLGSIDPP